MGPEGYRRPKPSRYIRRSRNQTRRIRPLRTPSRPLPALDRRTTETIQEELAALDLDSIVRNIVLLVLKTIDNGITTDALIETAEQIKAVMEEIHKERHSEAMQTFAHNLNNPLSVVTGMADLIHTNNLDDNKLLRKIQLHADTFTNPLSVVMGNVDSIKANNQDNHELLTTLRSQAQRMASMVSQVSHPEKREGMKKCDICALVSNHANRILTAQSQEINLVENYDENCFALVNEDAMRIIIENLIVNACQAGAKRIIIQIRRIGNSIFISIGDNGCGMPSEIREQIFDPFFTTKPPGKGVGIGLSITKHEIEAHGGKVMVESQTGDQSGTKFNILIPTRNLQNQ